MKSGSKRHKNKKNKNKKMDTKTCNGNGNVSNEPLGLENLGNTCFMNSALQCLSRTQNLIPKLELFGSGRELVLLVDNVKDDAQVSVIGASDPTSKSNEDYEDVDDVFQKEKDDDKSKASENGQGDAIEDESFKISMVIPSTSMTGRLKQCFKAITRCQDPIPEGSEPVNQRNYLKYGGNVFRPSDVHNMMSKHFRPGQQHDSHELLRTIVDMMKKDQTRAFRLAIMDKFGVKKKGQDSDPQMVSLVKSLDQKVRHKTFIDEIFGGELMTTQMCLTCQSRKRSHEEFLDLSLPIRVSKQSRGSQRNNYRKTGKNYSWCDEDENIVINRTVQDCLRAFTEPALLTGSNMVECENCHKINLENASLPQDDETAMEEDQPQKLVESTEDDVNDDMNVNKPKSDEEVEDDDSDLPPPLEGIGGNISDGDEEDNGVAPFGLADLPAHDKFEYFKLQSEDELEAEGNTVSETEGEKGTTADEGFSEGENSALVENEVQAPCPIGESGSSSRNSISDPDENNSKSSSNSANDTTVTTNTKKPATSKIPITKCPCSRQQTISRPPEFLTIHLKRFQISNRGYTSKLSDHVEFPMILDLTPFCVSPEDERDIEHRKDTIYDEDGQVMYSLYGIVEHSGSLHWGHYVAYIKVAAPQIQIPSKTKEDSEETNSEEPATVTKNKWYYISDSHVSNSSESAVKNRDPYILFYERIRGEEKKRRLLQQEQLISERNVDESGESSSFSNNAVAVLVPNGWNDSPSESSPSKTDADWVEDGNDWAKKDDENTAENWTGETLDKPLFTNTNGSEDEIPALLNETGTNLWGKSNQSSSQITDEVWDEPTDESSSQATVTERDYVDPDPWK